MTLLLDASYHLPNVYIYLMHLPLLFNSDSITNFAAFPHCVCVHSCVCLMNIHDGLPKQAVPESGRVRGWMVGGVGGRLVVGGACGCRCDLTAASTPEYAVMRMMFILWVRVSVSEGRQSTKNLVHFSVRLFIWLMQSIIQQLRAAPAGRPEHCLVTPDLNARPGSTLSFYSAQT